MKYKPSIVYKQCLEHDIRDSTRVPSMSSTLVSRGLGRSLP